MNHYPKLGPSEKRVGEHPPLLPTKPMSGARVVDLGISKTEIRHFRQQLHVLLAHESTHYWLKTMDFLYEKIPFLNDSNGRPTKKMIENSIIGELGHTSLRDFHQFEMKWSEDKWTDWRIAYSCVRKHPYLREMDISRNAILMVHKSCNNCFPDSETDMNTFLLERKQSKSRKKTETKSQADNDQSKQAESEIQELRSLLALAEEERDASQKELCDEKQLNEKKLSEASALIHQQSGELRKLKKSLQNKDKQIISFNEDIKELEKENKELKVASCFFVVALLVIALLLLYRM